MPPSLPPLTTRRHLRLSVANKSSKTEGCTAIGAKICRWGFGSTQIRQSIPRRRGQGAEGEDKAEQGVRKREEDQAGDGAELYDNYFIVHECRVIMFWVPPIGGGVGPPACGADVFQGGVKSSKEKTLHLGSTNNTVLRP